MARRGGPVKRKRRTGLGNTCVNPLFVKWVEELRDDTKERGLKCHHTYTKALNSLKKYPLPLLSGQEAKIIDNVGEKLAKILDKKLAEYHAATGTGSDSDCGDVFIGSKSTPKSAQSSQQKDSRSKKGGSDEATPPAAKRKISSREYIPAYKSGPYALIVALYNAREKPSWRGFLHKAELISDAQPFCNVSFTVPDAGSYYTAWSSMSSIIRKGLVQKISHPPKFSLTECGESMACRLLQGSTAASTSSQDLSESASSLKGRSSASKAPTSKTKRKSPAVLDCSPTQHSPLSVASTSSSVESMPHASSHQVTFVDSPPSRIPSDFSDSSDTEDPSVPDVCARPGGESLGTSFSESQSLLRFWYIDHSGKSVLEKDLATVTFNDIVTVGFLIKCKQADLDSAHVIYTIDECRKASGPFVYAYLSNMDAPERAKPPMEQEAAGTSVSSVSASPVIPPSSVPKKSSRDVSKAATLSCEKTSTSDLITLSDSDDEMDVLPLKSRVQQLSSQVTSLKGKERSEPSSSQLSGMSPGGFGSGETEGDVRRHLLTPSGQAALKRWNQAKREGPVVSRGAGGSSDVTAPSRPLVLGPQKTAIMRPCPVSAIPGAHGSGSASAGEEEKCETNVAPLGDPEFVFSPGSFEVVLIVDSSESTACRKSSSQFRGILLQELGKNGVMFDVRRLNVGDFAWVAREKATPKPGCLSLPKSREVVLDYIVERKRMDDLAGSIVDGRFYEQKFRLKHSGILHPVYLVEEHGDTAHSKIDIHTLNQAIANTQIVDGFFVKRTQDIRESVAYLTILTRSLQLAYSGKTIKAYSWEAISDWNKNVHSECDLTSLVTHGMEFSKFNEASIKNKTLTVEEMFGRHLMQLPGLSVDKAAVILKEYPTLKLLRDKYSSCTSERDKVNLIADLRYGRTNRRIGPSISELLYSVYCQGN